MSSAPKDRVSTSFSELEEEEIGEIVRAYLLENPEVIIEAVNEYSARERQARRYVNGSLLSLDDATLNAYGYDRRQLEDEGAMTFPY